MGFCFILSDLDSVPAVRDMRKYRPLCHSGVPAPEPPSLVLCTQGTGCTQTLVGDLKASHPSCHAQLTSFHSTSVLLSSLPLVLHLEPYVLNSYLSIIEPVCPIWKWNKVLFQNDCKRDSGHSLTIFSFRFFPIFETFARVPESKRRLLLACPSLFCPRPCSWGN